MPSVMVKRVVLDVKHVAQEMSPAAERAIGPVAETAIVPDASGNVQVLVSVRTSAVNSPTSELLLKNKLLPAPPEVNAAPVVTSPTAVISPPEPVAEIVNVFVVLSVTKVTPDPASTFKVVVVELAVMLVCVGTAIVEKRF